MHIHNIQILKYYETFKDKTKEILYISMSIYHILTQFYKDQIYFTFHIVSKFQF